MCIVVLRVLRTEGQMRHLLDVMDQDHLMWRVAGTCDQWQYHYYYYWSQVLNGKKLHTAFMMHHVICFIACSVITNMVYAPQSLKQSSENPYHKQCWAPILVCLNLCTKVKCYVSFVICYILSHHNLHILLEAFCACLVFLLLFLMILFSELPKQKHPFCIVNIILHGWSCWCVWMVSIEWPHKPQHEVENYNAIELIINTNWELWIW